MQKPAAKCPFLKVKELHLAVLKEKPELKAVQFVKLELKPVLKVKLVHLAVSKEKLELKAVQLLKLELKSKQ